ncbi:hypothetical protein [Roseimaritima ulvae]|uniref:hypothetical protein n=1 Tax=Roseimaritima ulvae TaxID=980254 RepID=UPI00082DFB13|nr:hypothetical protein [Roseimaritima ulvae]
MLKWFILGGNLVNTNVPRLKYMANVDPYQPLGDTALEIDQLEPTSSRFATIAPYVFVVLPILFGLTGFAGYIALVIAIERQLAENEPVLSYGQQAFLISLPICTMIAASTGYALAFFFARQRTLSIILLFVIALVSWLITWSFWNSQIAQYGRDASEVVLYYPPTGYAAAAACLGLLLSIALTVRRAKRGEP